MRAINRIPDRGMRMLLPALLFVAAVAGYLIASSIRRASNPDDKLLPGLQAMGDAIQRMAFMPDPRTGDYLLWVDTEASLERLLAGIVISALISFIVGITVGLLPVLRSLFGLSIAVLAMIPPLAILPIIFIVFGLGEVAKIVLIVIGTAPFLIRDLVLRVEEMPHEMLVKAQTLGASTWQIALRVVAPQMAPRLLDSLRFSLGAAWLFLISAEAIASENGLGYRIFLVRRYFAMDVILPYVAWITLLAFFLDVAIRIAQHRLFPWFAAARRL
jgi:NitT/TauT family transport system permease protein